MISSLAFQPSYKTASFKTIFDQSRTVITHRRMDIEERLVHFIGREEFELSRAMGIGPELSRLSELPRLKPWIAVPIANIAMKSGYKSLGRIFIASAISAAPEIFEPDLIGMKFSRRDGDYDTALQYVTRALERAAGLDVDIDRANASRLLQLVNDGIGLLLYDVQDIEHSGEEFLAEVRKHLATLNQDPFEPSRFLVTRAKSRWFVERQASIEDFDRAIESDISHYSINSYATWIKDVKGTLEEAEALYRKGLERFPKVSMLAYNLALVLLEQAKDTYDVPLLEEAFRLTRAILKSVRMPKLRQHVRATDQTLRHLLSASSASGHPEALVESSTGNDRTIILIDRMLEPKPRPKKAVQLSDTRQEQLSQLLTRAYVELECQEEVLATKLKNCMEKVQPGFMKAYRAKKFLSLLRSAVGPDTPIARIHDEYNGAWVVVFNAGFLSSLLNSEEFKTRAQNMFAKSGASDASSQPEGVSSTTKSGAQVVPASGNSPKTWHEQNAQLTRLLARTLDRMGQPDSVQASNLKVEMERLEPGFQHAYAGEKFSQILRRVVGSQAALCRLYHAGHGSLIVEFNPVVLRRVLVSEQSSRARTMSLRPAGKATRAEPRHPLVGKTLDATVNGFATFGLFVDVGDGSGLIHKNNFPRDTPFSSFRGCRGDTIQVRVLNIKAHGKLNLAFMGSRNSSHFPSDKPVNEPTESNLAVGDLIEAFVKEPVDYGVIVTHREHEGLVHICEFPRSKAPPKMLLRAGDRVSARILAIMDSGRLELSLLDAGLGSWEWAAQRFKPGTVHLGAIQTFIPPGALVEFNIGVRGLLPMRDVPGDARVGDTVLVRVISLNPILRQMRLAPD